MNQKAVVMVANSDGHVALWEMIGWWTKNEWLAQEEEKQV